MADESLIHTVHKRVCQSFQRRWKCAQQHLPRAHQTAAG